MYCKMLSHALASQPSGEATESGFGRCRCVELSVLSRYQTIIFLLHCEQQAPAQRHMVQLKTLPQCVTPTIGASCYMERD